MQRDRANHKTDKKADDDKKIAMRKATKQAFSESFHTDVSPFVLDNDYNGLLLHFRNKYSTLEHSQNVIDALQRALTSHATYSKCSSVSDCFSTWETTCKILIKVTSQVEHIPTAKQHTSDNAIIRGLYMSDEDYKIEFPATHSVLSYRERRTRILWPFGHLSINNKYKHLVEKYSTAKKDLSIEDIKTTLLEKEIYFSSLSSQQPTAPRAFLATAQPDSTITHDENLFQLTDDNNDDDAYASSAIVPEPKLNQAIYMLIQKKPCPICSKLGNRFPQEVALSTTHSLVTCATLTKFTFLSDDELRKLNYPLNSELHLPTYQSLHRDVAAFRRQRSNKRPYPGSSATIAHSAHSSNSSSSSDFGPATNF